MAIVCDTCKAEFKSVQGLRGHERMSHGVWSAPAPPPAPSTPELVGNLSRVPNLLASLQSSNEQVSQQMAEVRHLVTNDLPHSLDELSSLLKKASQVNEKAAKVDSDSWGLLLLIGLGVWLLPRLMRSPEEPDLSSALAGPVVRPGSDTTKRFPPWSG